MRKSPRLAAIWTRRSRKRAVGMPATKARNRRPRLPQEGRDPVCSRPSDLACAKSRFSITIAPQPAPAIGVEGDVVADGPRGCLGAHLVAPVGEGHGAGQAVAAVGAVGQM